MESMIISSVDNLWVLIAGILVMFMQPGFMLVETGFTRSHEAHGRSAQVRPRKKRRT